MQMHKSFRFCNFQIHSNCSRHRAGPAGRSSPRAAPLLPPHATQVAGGLGLSLTAANYRLTRPRCALHDCISPRSGYPERGRDGEWRRERWLGRIEKDGGGRERGDRKWQKGQRGRGRDRGKEQKGWMGEEKGRKEGEWEGGIFRGNQHSGLDRTD